MQQSQQQNVQSTGIRSESPLPTTQQQQQKPNLFTSLNTLNTRPVFGAPATSQIGKMKKSLRTNIKIMRNF